MFPQQVGILQIAIILGLPILFLVGLLSGSFGRAGELREFLLRVGGDRLQPDELDRAVARALGDRTAWVVYGAGAAGGLLLRRWVRGAAPIRRALVPVHYGGRGRRGDHATTPDSVVDDRLLDRGGQGLRAGGRPSSRRRRAAGRAARPGGQRDRLATGPVSARPGLRRRTSSDRQGSARRCPAEHRGAGAAGAAPAEGADRSRPGPGHRGRPAAGDVGTARRLPRPRARHHAGVADRPRHRLRDQGTHRAHRRCRWWCGHPGSVTGCPKPSRARSTSSSSRPSRTRSNMLRPLASRSICSTQDGVLVRQVRDDGRGGAALTAAAGWRGCATGSSR